MCQRRGDFRRRGGAFSQLNTRPPRQSRLQCFHTMKAVLIRGDGIAAQCCAHRLGGSGFRVVIESVRRPKPPAIMIGGTTQRMFQDVFAREDLFEGLPRITKRVVAWGVDSKAQALAHSAVVVDEQSLLERLGPKPPTERRLEDGEPGWTIMTSRPAQAESVEHQFGSRIVSATPVTLSDASDPSACWVESLDRGWLFLVPDGFGRGWLLAAGGPVESLLDGSRLVSEQISGFCAPASEFPAQPRIAWPLCGAGWLACGTGALAFDPLCGDGSGNAIREAILAAAVIRAVENGADPDELLAHYRGRLLAGFERHLQTCGEYYRGGGSTSWWTTQLESVRVGLAWCERLLGVETPFRYQLRGFDLQRIV
jgi:hypothetical protein